MLLGVASSLFFRDAAVETGVYVPDEAKATYSLHVRKKQFPGIYKNEPYPLVGATSDVNWSK